MFRTPTGQTGKDAYVFEASQIANAQRELDARFKRLRKTVAEEAPELFRHTTDFITADAAAAEHFEWYLQGREDEYLGGGHYWTASPRRSH